jgi:hypothetical protein
MRRVTASTVITTGPEPIWNLMSDPFRYPDFVDATERMVDVGHGEFGVGYVYKEYGGVKPFLGESEWRVTEFEPMRRQVHLGDDAKMRMPLAIELEPVDCGTKLTISFGLEPRWFLAPMNALLWPLMMRKRSQAVLDGTVANAKRIIEAE